MNFLLPRHLILKPFLGNFIFNLSRVCVLKFNFFFLLLKKKFFFLILVYLQSLCDQLRQIPVNELQFIGELPKSIYLIIKEKKLIHKYLYFVRFNFIIFFRSNKEKIYIKYWSRRSKCK